MSNPPDLHSGLNRRELLKCGLYGGLTAGIAGSLWISGCRRGTPSKKPNIIFITVDTLRADRLGGYGCSRATSPQVDRFAQDALLFERCLSHAPVTSSSFASILSGFLPHETKVLENNPLPPEVETLPEILQREQYKTAAVVSNYVLRRRNGWAKGFMVYDDRMDELELVRRSPERIAQGTTDRAIELLRQFQQERLFMWVHYQDPHGPYTPPARYAKMFLDANQEPRNVEVNRSLSGRGGIPSYQKLGEHRNLHYYVAQYDGEIRYFDEHFGRLMDALKQLGLYEEALIIFSSDHGEGLGEHNYYFAHGENLYAQLMHVPLIIRYGKHLTGRRTDFVQHLDIVPTIFEVLGRKVDSRFRGRDLRRKHPGDKEIFAEMASPMVKDGLKFSLVFGGLKLIYTPRFRQYELFDLNRDPAETSDLAKDASYQDRLADLRTRLERVGREDLLGLNIVNKPQPLTDEEREKLRSLGYVQ